MKQVSFFYRENTNTPVTNGHYLVLFAICVLGVIVRFWGLGNVGLHGDEETMAMPALQILETGTPVLPSGMVYLRAVVQLYLMALSVALFGVSEWALRFPSAVAGALLVPICYLLGRRFLRPNWNLVFVLIIALYPTFIVYSQTARMYIFMITFLALFAYLVLRWCDYDSLPNYLCALTAMIISIQFHTLSVFLASLFFLPFLLKPATKRLVLGIAGFFSAYMFYEVYSHWVHGAYFRTARDLMPESTRLSHADIMDAIENTYLGYVAVAAGMLVFVYASWQAISRKAFLQLLPLLLLLVALPFALQLQYIPAFLIAAAGMLTAFRYDANQKHVLAMAALLIVTCALQTYAVYSSGIVNGLVSCVKAIAYIQRPSFFVFRTMFLETPLAWLLYLCALGLFARRFVSGDKLPGHALLFLLAVFLPLLGVAFFNKIWFPTRYGSQVLVFFLLACVAGTSYVFAQLSATLPLPKEKLHSRALYVALAIFLVKPLELLDTVDPGYNRHPDHKGAAEFMASQDIEPDAVILAEDVLQQTFYMGSVDYWLKSYSKALRFVRQKDGAFHDIYTDTPLIGAADDFEALLQMPDRGPVYIIGSGETYGAPTLNLGKEMIETIERHNPKEIFVGRDGKTRIQVIGKSSS